MQETVLYLESGYLGVCDKEYTGTNTAEILIYVKVLEPDNTQSVYFSMDATVSNDSNDPDNLEFDIEIPETGAYLINVDVNVDCDDCCGSFEYCQDYDKPTGKPRYRGSSIAYDTDDGDDPSAIDVVPLLTLCASCGCTE